MTVEEICRETNVSKIAVDEKLVKFYKSPQARITELINFFFYGILPRESGQLGSGDARK